MEEIVEMGYHPQLGARALKRSVEKLISAPVSSRLTVMKPNAPTVISIREDDGLIVSVSNKTHSYVLFVGEAIACKLCSLEINAIV